MCSNWSAYSAPSSTSKMRLPLKARWVASAGDEMLGSSWSLQRYRASVGLLTEDIDLGSADDIGGFNFVGVNASGWGFAWFVVFGAHDALPMFSSPGGVG